MGKAKQTRKFAVAKKMISPKDTRVASNMIKAKAKEEQTKKKEEPRQVEQAVSALFFEYNTQLGPPYHVLVDTNFINFSIRYVYGLFMFVFCFTLSLTHTHNCAPKIRHGHEMEYIYIYIYIYRHTERS